MNKEICEFCKFVACYYGGKNRKEGCLKMAFCEHPKAPDYSQKRNRKYLATYRWQLNDKIKTSPRWCPLKTNSYKK